MKKRITLPLTSFLIVVAFNFPDKQGTTTSGDYTTPTKFSRPPTKIMVTIFIRMAKSYTMNLLR